MPNRILPWGSCIYVYVYLFCRKMTLQVAGEGDTVQGSSLPENVCGYKKKVLEQPGLSLCPPLIASVCSHFQKAGHCLAGLHLLGWFLAPPPPSRLPHPELAEI